MTEDRAVTDGGSGAEDSSGDRVATPRRCRCGVGNPPPHDYGTGEFCSTVRGQEPEKRDRLIRHVLLTGSYEGTPVISAMNWTDAFEVVCERLGVESIRAKAFTTSHFIRPEQGSLLEAWIALTDDERLALKDAMPRLFTAIFLTVRGTVPDEKKCDAAHPTYPWIGCAVHGKHEVHVSDPVDVGGSMVWR